MSEVVIHAKSLSPLGDQLNVDRASPVILPPVCTAELVLLEVVTLKYDFGVETRDM